MANKYKLNYDDYMFVRSTKIPVKELAVMFNMRADTLYKMTRKLHYKKWAEKFDKMPASEIKKLLKGYVVVPCSDMTEAAEKKNRARPVAELRKKNHACFSFKDMYKFYNIEVNHG